jgi:low-affinity inorganic phosphate transporter
MLHLFAGLDLHTGLLLLLALVFVLFYEAINGFHDTANAVATVIYTRAMRSQLAVVMAAVFNFWCPPGRTERCVCHRAYAANGSAA